MVSGNSFKTGVGGAEEPLELVDELVRGGLEGMLISPDDLRSARCWLPDCLKLATFARRMLLIWRFKLTFC
jgi:hypothetical protein